MNINKLKKMAIWTEIGKDLVKEGVFEVFPDLKKGIFCRFLDLKKGIFERFPELIPAVGEPNYWKGEQHLKLLIVGESNYFEDELESESDFKDFENWYTDENCRLIPEGKIKYVSNWKGGRGHNNIFRSMKKVLDEKGIKNYDKDLLPEAAYYNYFLRPASVKNKNCGFKKDCKPIDCQISYIALRGIIKEIKPDIVIFVSKFAHGNFLEFYEKEVKYYDGVVIDCANHFSRKCWNQPDGKQRFENLLWKYWFPPKPIIKKQTLQLFNDFQTNPFWNKEIWGDINWYDEKDATCAYFDNISKNISIDIYCVENDQYQFQIFERDKFKEIKPSGVEWIQNIPNLTTKGSRHESRLQSREDITEILEKLMK